MSVLERRGLILKFKIVRQSQEIKQEEVEVKVPGDKDPDDVFYDFRRAIFTVDRKSMKLTMEDDRTREAEMEPGAILTKFMGQPVTSRDDVKEIKEGLGDQKPAEWVFTFNRVS